MTIYRIGLAAAAIVIAAPVTAQAGDLAAVQASLRDVTTMTAAFIQTDRNNRQLSGLLTLKRPGHIRFEYQKDTPILIVADGKALTFIDYSVRQVQRWPIKNSPLGVLLDPTRDLARYAKLMPTLDPNIVPVEIYDKSRPEYGRITLVFARQPSAPAGLLLQGWVALDSQSHRTTIRLNNQQFNVPVADTAFAWTDPRHPDRKH